MDERFNELVHYATTVYALKEASRVTHTPASIVAMHLKHGMSTKGNQCGQCSSYGTKRFGQRCVRSISIEDFQPDTPACGKFTEKQ